MKSQYPVFHKANARPERSYVKVKHTQTSPLAELLAIGNLNQRNLVLAAKGNDQLLVGLLLTCLVEHTHVSLATVEGLAGLTETTGKAVVDESDLEDSLQGVENGHAASRAAAALGWHFDLISLRDLLDVGGLFSVRLFEGVRCVLEGDRSPMALAFEVVNRRSIPRYA